MKNILLALTFLFTIVDIVAVHNPLFYILFAGAISDMVLEFSVVPDVEPQHVSVRNYTFGRRQTEMLAVSIILLLSQSLQIDRFS